MDNYPTFCEHCRVYTYDKANHVCTDERTNQMTEPTMADLTDDAIRGLNVNGHANMTLASDFLDAHTRDDAFSGWYRDPIEETGIFAIRADGVDDLADALLDFVANVIVSILNAGSERDAVNENEELLTAITKELRGWTKEGQ